MKEILEVPVIDNNGEEQELKFEYDTVFNTVDIYFAGEKVCGADYSNNLVYLFQRGLQMWGFAKNFNED